MFGSLFQVSMITGPSFGIARFNAASSTTSPREALMNMAPGLIIAKNSSFAIPLVVSLRGTCKVTMSALVNR